jgi:hypothetical protein
VARRSAGNQSFSKTVIEAFAPIATLANRMATNPVLQLPRAHHDRLKVFTTTSPRPAMCRVLARRRARETAPVRALATARHRRRTRPCGVVDGGAPFRRRGWPDDE